MYKTYKINLVDKLVTASGLKQGRLIRKKSERQKNKLTPETATDVEEKTTVPMNADLKEKSVTCVTK